MNPMKAVFTFTIVLCAGSLLTGITVEDIYNQLRANQTAVNDIRGKMTIKTVTPAAVPMPSMEQEVDFMYKGSNMSRMDYKKPYQQTVARDGKYTYMKKANGNVIKTKDSKPTFNPQQNPVGFNFLDLFVGFNASVANGAVQNTYVITLTPKSNYQFIGRFELAADLNKKTIDSVKAYGTNAKMMTSIIFSNQMVKDNIYYPVRMEASTYTDKGTITVINEVKHVQVNTGISDNEFKLE